MKHHSRDDEHEHIMPGESFRRYTEHGGYPLVYVTDNDEPLCSMCARQEHWGTLHTEINSTENLFCAGCENFIESMDSDEDPDDDDGLDDIDEF